MANLTTTDDQDHQPIINLAAKLLLVALAYFAAGKLGLAIPYIGSHITLMWLPAGISVAAYLRWGFRCWPGVFLGAFVTEFSVDQHAALAIVIALGNTLAPLLAAWLLRRLQFHPALDRAHDILLLILAATLGMLISASIGISSLLVFDVIPLQDAVTAWLAWWGGDFVGVLLAAPLLLNLSRAELKKLASQRFEFLVWCAFMLVVSWVVFFYNHDDSSYSLPLAFMVLPFVVWSAMRFSLMGSSLGVLMPVLIAAWATSRNTGPFDNESTQHGLLILWLYFITLVVLELMVSGLQAGRNRAEAVLQESEARTKLILDTAMDAVISSNQGGMVLGWNREAELMFGYSAEQAMGRDLTSLIVPSYHRQAHQQGMQRFIQTGKGTNAGSRMEITAMHADGREFPVELTLVVVQRQGEYFFNAFIRDITERKAAEAKIRRLTQLYAALSQCNQAIVRCTSEAELFAQICLDAVKFGGFKMAWIGMRDEASDILKPVACYGTGMEYLEGIQISSNPDQPSGRGPIGIVMRENRPYWCQDYLKEPLLALWHERGARAGWGSSAAIPLRCNGKVVGTFSIYAAEVNAFDEEIQKLLIEMGSDIDFALDNYANEASRKFAQEQLHKLTAHLQSVREEEKTKIAREIHDELGGTMTALKIEAHRLKEDISSDTNKQLQQQHIASMAQLIDSAAGIARRIISDLRPSILDDIGLLAAIEWKAKQFHESTGIDYLVNCIGDKGKLNDQYSIALFRILQESLSNVSRHAGATRVEIEFHHSEDEVMLSISDNGRGLTAGQVAKSGSFGMIGMRERVAQLGGTIRFDTAHGGGLSVIVILPLTVNREGET